MKSKLNETDKYIILKSYGLFQSIVDCLCYMILKDIKIRKQTPVKAISESRAYFLETYLAP